MKLYQIYLYNLMDSPLYFFHTSATGSSHLSSYTIKGAFDYIDAVIPSHTRNMNYWTFTAECDSLEDLEENYPELFI